MKRDVPRAHWQTEQMPTEILYKDESYKIVGACFEVYREKGCGFLEAVYQECLEIELRLPDVLTCRRNLLLLNTKAIPCAQPTSRTSFAMRNGARVEGRERAG